MPQTLAISLAEKILQGFKTYMDLFDYYSKLAPVYLKKRNWVATKLNHRQGLRLYKDLFCPYQ
jgi:isocitrate dehydrogenase kinase/phosphatase